MLFNYFFSEMNEDRHEMKDVLIFVRRKTKTKHYC